MKRTVGVERTYYISQYSTIRPVEYLNEIPDEYATNETFINKVRFIQLLNMDITFKKYLVLMKEMEQLNPKEAIIALEELKAKAMDELNQILNKEA